MKKVNWKLLLVSFLVVYLTAFIGSLFTSGNTNTDWYEATRPSITPPNFVFPIVWNILFFLIALALYFSLTQVKNKKTKFQLKLIFGINLTLNALWSLLYFKLKNPLASFIELILIWTSIIFMIYITRKINKKISYLLIPYLLWVSFAGILNLLSIK